MKKPWFKAKTYGYGWYPSTWQGWTVLLIWIVLFVMVFIRIDEHSHSVSDTLYGVFIPYVVLVALLILVCWLTGEKARWRWGK